ncbi:hypothetical protein ACP275_08G120600 [Erythranthe tilingii]
MVGKMVLVMFMVVAFLLSSTECRTIDDGTGYLGSPLHYSRKEALPCDRIYSCRGDEPPAAMTNEDNMSTTLVSSHVAEHVV